MSNIKKESSYTSSKTPNGMTFVIVIALLLIAIIVIAIFNINPLAPFTKDDTPYMLFISDTHVGRVNGEKNLARAITSINNLDPQPEFIIIGGDNTDWGEGVSGKSNWRRFLNELNRLNCEWYITPGNHDYRFSWQITPPYSLKNYDLYFNNHSDYVLNHNDFHFIVLNTGHDYWEATLTPNGTGLTNSQFQWLKHDLDMLDGEQNEEDTSGRTKIIVMHHPAMDIGNKGVGCIMNNRLDFINLCTQYNVYAVLSGHTHKDSNLDFLGSNYRERSSGTQFTTTLSVLESVGYRKVTLDKSQLPKVLPDSQSFDWKSAVKSPKGDYFGDIK